MGFAKIVSGGPDGRYTIFLDWGQSTKDSVLLALSSLQAKLNVDLGNAQEKLAEGKERAAALSAQVAAEIAAIVLRQGTLPPGSPASQDDKVLKFLLEEHRKVQVKNAPLQFTVDRIKFDITATKRNIAYWNTFQATETRTVWCTDLTEDREPGVYAATMDIPGDDSLIVLAPGARSPTDADGYLQAREMMSPPQAFFNTAIQPGWAKFKPTYRWGTIVEMDYPNERAAKVTLAAAVLTGQRLDVNQEDTLLDVPIEYMVCNSGPFEVGDRVVVQFQGQDWDSPRIVGFLDNPKPCNWVCRGSYGGSAVFASLIPDLMASISGTSIDIRGRLNSGAWTALEYVADIDVTNNKFESPNEADVGGGIKEYSVFIFTVSFGVTPVFPCIFCAATPPLAALTSTDLSLRNIVEIAIYVGGAIVFNVAFTDIGWSGSAQRADGMYVKSPGGIQIGYPNDGAVVTKRMSEFTDYTLISEEP